MCVCVSLFATIMNKVWCTLHYGSFCHIHDATWIAFCIEILFFRSDINAIKLVIKLLHVEYWVWNVFDLLLKLSQHSPEEKWEPIERKTPGLLSLFSFPLLKDFVRGSLKVFHTWNLMRKFCTVFSVIFLWSAVIFGVISYFGQKRRPCMYRIALQ